jgi:hypothetical protein
MKYTAIGKKENAKKKKGKKEKRKGRKKKRKKEKKLKRTTTQNEQQESRATMHQVSVPFAHHGRQTGARLKSHHRAITARNILRHDNLVLVAVHSGGGNIVRIERVIDVRVHVDILEREVVQQEVPLEVTECI